jgi:class 3 adenylate cyclase/tetratricopeptide (TPR) repeat protein
VKCASCGHEVRAESRFCEACGSPQARACSSCGSELSATARFCESCGRSVDVVASPNAQIAGTLSAQSADEGPVALQTIDGERKQVTVMFVDIVGSMELAESLDSERWRGVLARFFALASDSVRSVRGTIDKFTGDGVMALFGAPVAHEDHARRACLAALDLHASLAPLTQELAADGVELAIRVGLNSGEVIVGELGDGGKMDYTAIGHTVGLAQRMESLAPRGSTALSVATGVLVAGEFDVRELGEFEVKGSSVSQRVFELVGRAPSRDRVEAAGARGGLSPFVGREREQAALQAALDRAVDGDGQVVGLVGEPGVGKSRLAHEFTERCAAEGISVQRVRAFAHGGEVPLLPVLELMRSMLGVFEADTAAGARAQIAQSLQALDASFQEDLPLVFDFLGVADPEHPGPTVDPQARQRQLLSLVRRFVHARSRVRTTVTLIEDLHWLDDASRVFLAELVRASSGTRTLLILTYRPEYAADVLRGSHCEQLALRPLARGALGELLASLLGDDRSLDGLADLIAAHAVGNPFFCEELVAALAASGHLAGERGAYRLSRTLQEVVLPATVQATLAARIDRLEDREKELLQTVSVIGYEVSAPLLRAIAGLGDGELDEALDSVVSAELLVERSGEMGVEYAFKHPLTQEVAYRSQLTDRRVRVHRDVALAIERLYPDRLDERAALVAQHWEAAGDRLAAVRWHARSATWVGFSDISQAVTSWRKVGELTELLPESDETTALALAAHVRQLSYGWRLGMSEREAGAHYEAGRELALRSGDSTNLLLITATYASVRGFAGHVQEASELGEEVNRLSIEIGDPALRIAALAVPTWWRLIRGRLQEALALADEAIVLGSQDPALGSGLSSLVCPYGWALTTRAALLCSMGQLDQAAGALERALQVVHEQRDLETEGTAHSLHVALARYTGQTEMAFAHATHAHEIAERIGSALSRVWALHWLGYARLILGDAREAISAFERSIELAREARTGLEVEAVRVAGLSEALLIAGDHPRALEAAQESVALARQRGNDAVLPVCYRVLAEALLASADPGKIASAQQALENAAAAIEATGACAELPFLERAREKLLAVT